jgi:hypothetical protein
VRLPLPAFRPQASRLSPALPLPPSAFNAIAIPMAFVDQWVSDALYVLVALMWLVPDSGIGSRLTGGGAAA